MKKIILSVATVLPLLLGASLGSSAVVAQELSGTLTFAASSSQEAGWTGIIEAFKKAYPNVKVRANLVPIRSYNQMITTQLQGGQGPDVMFTSAGSAFPTAVGQLVPQGRLRDLSDLDANKYIPDFLSEVGTWDGTRYAMAIGAYSGFYIYNSDKFAELGLEPPQTAAEFIELCKAISSKGLTPIAVGPTSSDLANIYTLPMAAMVLNDDPEWITKRNADEVTFAGTPGWRAALQSFVDMKDANCFDPGVAGMARAAATASYVQEQSLMMPILQSQLGRILAGNPDFEWAAFPAPGITPDQQTMFLEFSPHLSINADTKNEALAIAFMNFAMAPEQTVSYSEAQGVISIGQLAAQELPEYLSSFTKYLYKGGTPPRNPNSMYKTPSTYNVLSKGLVGLITGQVTVDGLLADLDETYGQK